MVVKITSPENQNLPVGELMNNESSSLLSNNTQQGSPVGEHKQNKEEHKQNITSPQGVNKTTDTPYPDVLLEEVIEEEEPEMWQQQGLQDEQQQLSIAENQITAKEVWEEQPEMKP